jgi:hypothetical protein
MTERINIKDVKQIRTLKAVNVQAFEQQDHIIPEGTVLHVVHYTPESKPIIQYLDGFTVTYVGNDNKTYSGIHVPSNEIGTNYEIVLNGGARIRKQRRSRTRKSNRKRRSNFRKTR